MTHTEAQELLTPYALGILEDAELGSLEQHLSSCAFCANLAQEASSVTASLAYATEYRRPPVDGLERLLRGVQELQTSSAERQSRPAAARPESQPAPFGLLSWLWRFIGRPRWPSPAPLLATLLIALGLGFWNMTLMDRLRGDRSEMDELNSRVTHQSELLFMIASDQVVSRPLQNSDFAPNAEIRIVMDTSKNKAMLLANHLPQLAAGWIYRVWLARSGNRVPAGQLVVDRQGFGECPLITPDEIHSYDSAWITVEPLQATPAAVSTGVARGSL